MMKSSDGMWYIYHKIKIWDDMEEWIICPTGANEHGEDEVLRGSVEMLELEVRSRYNFE